MTSATGGGNISSIRMPRRIPAGAIAVFTCLKAFLRSFSLANPQTDRVGFCLVKGRRGEMPFTTTGNPNDLAVSMASSRV